MKKITLYPPLKKHVCFSMEACLRRFNIVLKTSPNELGFWVNDESNCVLVTKIGIRTIPEHTDAEPRLVWFKEGVESGRKLDH